MQSEISELLKRVEVTDKEEDRRYGNNKRGDELPQELAFRESRLKKIREARAALEAEARQAAEKNDKRGGQPEDKDQRNFTDSESHIMPAPGGKYFIQAYNAQAAVDSAHQIIVAAETTNKPRDKGQADPLLEKVKENTGHFPKQTSADAGYFSSETVTALTGKGMDVYMPPDRSSHADFRQPSSRGRIPRGLSIADRMRRKLRTQKGRQIYGLRKELPEPVFGQIKQVRGFRQFLFRGLDKVSGEWKVICTGHNLLKLFGAWKDGLVPADLLA